jgi:pimeloyl-ACP methyl ester carboxylesterase
MSAEQSTPLSAEGVSALASFIIRPPRARYSRRDLGHRRFHTENPRPVTVVRTDLQLVNARGHTLQCSHYIPQQEDNGEGQARGDNGRVREDSDNLANDPSADGTGAGSNAVSSRAMPAVVFLHGNGSCRVEAEVLFDIILPYGMSVFSFDFSGSGRSDGEYISLGVFEMYDVETVVSYLSKCEHVSSIALWGHSMGAATAAMYAGRLDPSCSSPTKRWRIPSHALPAVPGSTASTPPRPPLARPPSRISRSRSSRRFNKQDVVVGDDGNAGGSPGSPLGGRVSFDVTEQSGSSVKGTKVKALVLDSAFASFERLAEAMVETMPLPPGIPKKLVLSVGVRAVRKAVKDEAGFDVYDIDPLSATKHISPNMAAILLQGTLDEIVHPQHAEMLYEAYPGKDKELIVMENVDHESPRPGYAMERAFILLQRALFNEGNTLSMRYVEALKTRGNDVMVDGRFKDAILLYSSALEALVARERASASCEQTSRGQLLRDGHAHTSASLGAHLERADKPNEFGLRLPSCDSNEWPESVDGEVTTDTSGLRRTSKAISTKIGDIFTVIGRRVNTGLWASARRGTGKENGESPRARPSLDDGVLLDSNSHPASRDNENAFCTSPRGGISTPGSASPHRDAHFAESSERPKRSRMPTSSRGLRRVTVSGPGDGLSSERLEKDSSRRRSDRRRAEASSLAANEVPSHDDAASYIEQKGVGQERLHVALALLGNRSLAKLRMQLARGSLDDAQLALKLDRSWIRGYQRKASALKALGLLVEAQSCVAEGLLVSPTSVTLLQMSAELEQLANQRGDAGGNAASKESRSALARSEASTVFSPELARSGSVHSPDIQGPRLAQGQVPLPHAPLQTSAEHSSGHIRPDSRTSNPVSHSVESTV